jgi:GNAT superfamily N-acetyltransferase
MSGAVELSTLDAAAIEAAASDLGEVLADCVNGGASVNFMLPYGREDAAAFFRKVATSVARGDTILIAARLNGRIVGTVQLGIDMPPNQPHRADVKKLLVCRDARNNGVGNALMERIEQVARDKSRTLLVLDTANEAAERLYARRGWQRLGVVPDFALWPAGGYCDTIFFWKKL